MKLIFSLRQVWIDFLVAIQFLTRIRVPLSAYEPDALSRSVKFFPVVGLLIGGGAALLRFLLQPHLPTLAVALLLVAYLVLVTGALHEDGLADAADGFGGGWDREKILTIMRDSRIGSYGAIALILSLTARIVLIESLSPMRAAAYLITAQVLCRWTTLPLSFWLAPARKPEDAQAPGQGARIARLTTLPSFLFGSLFTLIAVVALLKTYAVAPILVAVAVTALSGLYYRYRIGGVTGDCFGATNQLAEIAIYLCGVWA